MSSEIIEDGLQFPNDKLTTLHAALMCDSNVIYKASLQRFRNIL